jgi:hypothetical protein
MMPGHYEYKIVHGIDFNKVQGEITALGLKGWKVVSMSTTSSPGQAGNLILFIAVVMEHTGAAAG